MKKWFCLYFTLFALNIHAQEKLISKSGTIMFEASVPSYEEVSAVNKEVSCILNLKNNEISSLAFVKSFRFKLSLMEQHFNENYIESDRYPKSYFKGKIENFNVNTLTEKPTAYTIKGNLELHGKTKKISFVANIKKINDAVIIQSFFTIKADEFGINIPSMVKNKVSNTINITSEFTLK